LGYILFIFCLLLPVAGMVAGAADYQGTIRLGGTGGAHGLMTQVTAAFQKKHPEVRFLFSPSLGSTGGIKAALARALDLGLSARALTAEELRQGAVAVAYGRTPMMLVTSHKGVKMNFTLEQIASLYAGDLKSYADKTPIRLILRPLADSDTDFLLGLSPQVAAAFRKAQAREGMIVAVNDQDNAMAMEKIKGAMGWITLAQVLSEKVPVTPLTIGNIMPSLETMAAGAYPYYKSFSVVTGAKPTPLAQAFIGFLTSIEAREILLQNGLLAEDKRP